MIDNNSTTEKKVAGRLDDVKNEIAKVIIGQDDLIDRLLIAILVGGHVLLEGVPGLAKTKTLVCLSQVIAGSMSRVQFTPDLLPADIIGTEIYRPQSGDFELRKGPIFANLVLADEINRAPAKVQSALLEAMAERSVTIGKQQLVLPKPFLVLATQNPIEQAGTYELPEAQLDRFLMKLNVTYPSFAEELTILEKHSGLLYSNTQSGEGSLELREVISPAELVSECRKANSVFVDDRINNYVVRLIHATRYPKEYDLDKIIQWGASPRGSLALKNCSQALAYLRGNSFVSPDEVKDVAFDVLRHRLILTFEAEGDSISADDVITMLLSKVKIA
jgi:MoxR-like ATPase